LIIANIAIATYQLFISFHPIQYLLRGTFMGNENKQTINFFCQKRMNEFIIREWKNDK
jgi:hypothetical protein